MGVGRVVGVVSVGVESASGNGFSLSTSGNGFSVSGESTSGNGLV